MAHEHIVLIHLICAIFFLGAITTEVLVLAPLHRYLSLEDFRRIEFLMFRQIRRTYPLFLLPLYGSGFWMYYTFYSGADGLADFLSTTFGLMLTIKLVLAMGLFTIFALAPLVFMPLALKGKTFRQKLLHMLIVTGDETRFLINRFDGVHYLAFGLGLAIVIIAKTMFFL
jgi:hypothetical protein